MDPAALLLSVNALCHTIDTFLRSYAGIPDTLTSIRSQLESLENTLEIIQQWQAYADPQSEAHVLPGLRESWRSIGGCLERLQEDVNSSPLPDRMEEPTIEKPESRPVQQVPPLDREPDSQRRFVDIKQCVALALFSLKVCQLPFGRHASQESKELVLAARTLQHVHTSNDSERRKIITAQRLVGDQHGSTDFKAWLLSVLEAEILLDTLPPTDSSMSQTPRLTKPPSQSQYDELYLPENQSENGISSPPATVAKARSAEASETPPALPPKVQEPPSRSASTALQKQLSRKPVKSDSVRRMSGYAESILSDMTLMTSDVSSPVLEKSPTDYLYRRDSMQQSTDTLGPTTSRTNALFSQASRSLNSLAQDVENVQINGEPDDSPPPYVNHRTPSFPRDVKRRDTQNSMDISAENLNLIQIVRENQIDLLRVLLDHGTNIDEVDPTTKRTAIVEATNLRRSRISQILIRAGCRLHLKDVDGNTALHFAASNGDSNTCVLLLNAGAQLDEYNREGETPLDLAARSGHTEVVVCLLNTWVTRNGHAAMLLQGFLEATKSGNASTARAFIERGVQPKKLKESWKPVVYAAQSGSIPMMDLMLAEKCNIKVKCPEGWTALHYASQAGHTAMVEKLLAWKMSWNAQTSRLGETALHIAILAGQISTAVALIYHKNANISTKDNDNHQAIHHAVRSGDVQLTTLLLNKGAKLDSQTNYGWTPMLIAAAYGHLPLVAEFITRGVSVEDKLQQPSNNPGKKTNEAARKGYWCEIRWPHPGARAIHLALEFGNDDVVRTLIASGAKINEEDSKGWKPLHYAAWNCRPFMVELLLTRGASPHNTTDDGSNPSSLGFREHGLATSMDERQSVFELLQAAMHARRKSTLTKITEFKGIGPRKTKDVGERNRAWHTAELAAALYLAGQLEDSETDGLSQLAPSMSSLNRRESREQEVATPTQASSSRITKRPTD